MGRGETPGAQSALGLSLPRCDRAGSMYPASPPRAEPAVKIAVWHNLPSGGGKRALYYHVRGLVERGHQVSCWCLDTANQSFLPLSEFAPERVVPTEFRKPRVGLTSWLAPWYSEAVARMREFDKACRRCAKEIA